jgi:hypothetical protein
MGTMTMPSSQGCWEDWWKKGTCSIEYIALATKCAINTTNCYSSNYLTNITSRYAQWLTQQINPSPEQFQQGTFWDNVCFSHSAPSPSYVRNILLCAESAPRRSPQGSAVPPNTLGCLLTSFWCSSVLSTLPFKGLFKNLALWNREYGTKPVSFGTWLGRAHKSGALQYQIPEAALRALTVWSSF